MEEELKRHPFVWGNEKSLWETVIQCGLCRMVRFLQKRWQRGWEG